MTVPRFRVPLLMLCVGVLLQCGELTAPGLEGPPFMSASINLAPWYVDTSSASGALAAALFSNAALALDGSEYRRRCPCRVILVYAEQVAPGRRYRLGGTSSSAYAGYQFTDSTYTHHLSFSTTDTHPGELAIASIDTARHLVTGTFVFEAKNDSGSAIVHISAGQFRVRYP